MCWSSVGLGVCRSPKPEDVSDWHFLGIQARQQIAGQEYFPSARTSHICNGAIPARFEHATVSFTGGATGCTVPRGPQGVPPPTIKALGATPSHSLPPFPGPRAEPPGVRDLHPGVLLPGLRVLPPHAHLRQLHPQPYPTGARRPDSPRPTLFAIRHPRSFDTFLFPSAHTQSPGIRFLCDTGDFSFW